MVKSRGVGTCLWFSCDNCAAHCSENLLNKRVPHGILVLTYPPHTFRLFEVFEALLFTVLEHVEKYEGTMHCHPRLITSSGYSERQTKQPRARQSGRRGTRHVSIIKEEMKQSVWWQQNRNHRIGWTSRAPGLQLLFSVTMRSKSSQRWGLINRHLFRQKEREGSESKSWIKKVWKDWPLNHSEVGIHGKADKVPPWASQQNGFMR
jgi:hypothetical protein